MKDYLKNIELLLSLLALATFATFAQIATTNSFSFKNIIFGSLMSCFVVYMAYIGLEALNITGAKRIFLAGTCAYLSRYILSALNSIGEEIKNDPLNIKKLIKKLKGD